MNTVEKSHQSINNHLKIRYADLDDARADLVQSRLEGRCDLWAELAVFYYNTSVLGETSDQTNGAISILVPRRSGKTMFLQNMHLLLRSNGVEVMSIVNRYRDLKRWTQHFMMHSQQVGIHLLDTIQSVESVTNGVLRGKRFDIVLVDDVDPDRLKQIIESDEFSFATASSVTDIKVLHLYSMPNFL